MSRHQKGKTNLDFTEARDSEWQWNPLGHMQVCTLLQRDNHASNPPLSFLQTGCPSYRPTNSVKALKAHPQADKLRWRRGVVVSGVRRMNEANPRRARLQLGWVTVFGRVYHLGMQQAN